MEARDDAVSAVSLPENKNDSEQTDQDDSKR